MATTRPYSNAPVRQDPLWAQVCLILGALLLVGGGAFIATVAALGGVR